MAVAGINLPTDRVFDGMDLNVLFAQTVTQTAPSAVPTKQQVLLLFFYRAATWTNATEEIYAVRCGDHKVYWRTWGVSPPEGVPAGVQVWVVSRLQIEHSSAIRR